jgi:hypothetical protein
MYKSKQPKILARLQLLKDLPLPEESEIKLIQGALDVHKILDDVVCTLTELGAAIKNEVDNG